MCVLAFALLTLYASTSCNAEFFITTAPDGIRFIPNDDATMPLRRRELPSVINFLMCLPDENAHSTKSWKGVSGIDVFNPPKANLLITMHLPEDSKFSPPKYVMKYTTDELESSMPPIFNLNSAIVSRYHNKDLVKSFVLEDKFQNGTGETIDLQKIRRLLEGEQSVLEILPANSNSLLDVDNDVDVQFFGELQMLKECLDYMDSVQSIGEPRSFHIMLTSIDHLSKAYGANSLQVKEAIALLQYYIPHFIESMNSRFHGQLLSEVEVITGIPAVSEYLVRHARSLLQASTGTNVQPLNRNIAVPNSKNFAVVFTIVLWFMLFFFLAVLAASYSMWFMDPGKDNIIYRVTSQRIKTD